MTGTSTAITTAQAFNLTSQETGDWAHWGTSTATSFDHKTSGNSSISNYTLVGTGTVARYTNNLTGYTWTDGTPTASATNSTTGIYIPGTGNGFSFTVPAGTTSRTLTVYVGGYLSDGKLSAHLSDGSATDFTDSSYGYNLPGNINSKNYLPVYTLAYNAASAGQTLKVTWAQTAGTGNVTLQSAALTPAAPTNVVATPISPTQINLTWTAPAGTVTGYNIKRGTVSGGPYTTVGTSTTAGYSDTGLTAATRYYYVVTAVNGGSESVPSSEVLRTTLCNAPTNLTATATSTQIGLTWTASAGATSYSLYRGTSAGGEGATAYKTGLTGTSVADTSVTSGTTYYYTVKAINNGGTSAASNEASATVSSGSVSLSSVTLTPTSVTGGSSSTGTVTLSGNAPTGGVSVSLSSSSSSATVPANVTVAAGSSTATFQVTTASVTAATSATITATYSGVNKTATLMVNPSISLVAAATSSNKVTLYWNGLSGASGYNVYRATVSGGPYMLIASNVATADSGPGLSNAFLYSDTASLTTGTEYFYIVRAVQSGIETVQSNEDSDIPQTGAVPWDTGDPVQILNAETTQLDAVLPPNIDPDTGDFIPAEVGLLTVQGPDGVIYESADTEGDPITTYAAPGSYDGVNNQLLLSDGETIPVPAPNTVQTGNGNVILPATSGMRPDALPQNFNPIFSYQFDPSSGIQREIMSLPGYVGLSTTELIFPCPATTPGDIQLNKSGSKNEFDSADIYSGGFINGVFNTELDAGLVLATSNPSTDPAWQPVTFNYYDHHNMVTPGRPKVVSVGGKTLTGYERILLYGDATSPLQMSFVTSGESSRYLQGQVVLNFFGQYQKITRNPADRSIAASGAKLTGSVTLVSAQPQWKWKNRSSMIIKRVSSIAQNIPPKQQQFSNGSFMYGGAWGGDGSIDQEGQLLETGLGYVDWDQSATWLAGGYPFPGTGYLYYVAQIPYHWENHINLSTTFDGNLSSH